MRLKLLRLVTVIGCFVLFSVSLKAQNCIPTNINGAIINLACNQVCTNLNFQIPHLKSTSDYTQVSVPYTPYPYNTPTGSEYLPLYFDDQYSNLINLPFTFCFYDALYTKAVVGSNGLMTFDPVNASCANAYILSQPIPYAGGSPCIQTTTYYPRASIMGAFSDLDPSIGPSPGDRKIQWEVVGTAPCRKFVVSYYHIGVFGNTCGQVTPNTFQMVMHESTGIIEIFIQQKACFSTTNGGTAIMGIQNWFQNKALAAPGKNNTVWSENFTGYSFIPSSGASRYVVSELYTLGAVLVATADTITTTPGLLDLSFPNVCIPAGNNTYVVKTTFSACENPAIQLISYDTVFVNRNTNLNATAVPTATSCSGANNGQIAVTPNGGTAPYTFILNPGAITQIGNTALFTGLAAMSYTVMVNDNVGCFTSPPISVTIVAGPVLTTTATVTDALCNGGATGTITVVQPAIGTPPFEYSLNGSPWQINPNFPGLTAGTYTVSYRESNGCQGSHQEVINEPTAMNSSANVTAAICNGQNNGTITVIAGGGVAPYEYSIDGGLNWQSNNVFTKGAGVYTIIIRDANNCTVPQIATVTEPAVLTAAAVNNNASCDGGNDGLITITANGGNGGFQYSIDGGPFQALNTFNVAPGIYTITVEDNLGCTYAFNTTVGLTNNLTFTPQIDPTICEGNSTQLQLVSNATVYSWTPATGLSNTTISNPVANPMVTTPYTVTATLGRCSANDIVIVNVNPAPVPDAGPGGFICYGQTYQLQGSGGVQYTWTPSTNLSSTSISNPVSTPIKTITYTLSEVIDAIGCKSLTTDQVTVDVTPPIKVKTFPYDTIGYPGDQFRLNATSAATFYSWSPVTGLSNPNIPNPVLTVGPVGSDVLYQVIASTAAGCKGEGYVNLKVYKGPELYVPSAFTPNGDGLNDLFYPFPVGIKSINYFKVFNRWGQLLFSSTTLYKGWDGKLQGVEQPAGIYVFMAKGVDKNGKLLTRQGTVVLIH